MKKEMIIQGRKLFPEDIQFIKKFISDNPNLKRTPISKEICKKWKWYTSYGQLKDMACRTMLYKLEKLGYIILPPSTNPNINKLRTKLNKPALHSTEPVNTKLKELLPLKIERVNTAYSIRLFKTFLSIYHYLSFKTTVGENIKYLVSNKNNTPLACLLFGSAAWTVAPRDSYIGWNKKTRKQNLQFITNNQRFLILPWINVKYLASHILGKIVKRISNDWQEKYKHPIHLLETFVEKDRFPGTCYKAANWIYVGQTKGRTRNDKSNRIVAPIKDIYLYPTNKYFKEELLSC